MIKYDREMLQTFSKFEKVTGAKLKDVANHKDTLVFIVENGEMGKALGKGKRNIEKLRKVFNKNIKIVEFSTDEVQFVRNLLFPLKPDNVQEIGNEIIIQDSDRKTKGLIIGAKASNLRNYESIVQRYFDINEIKVR